MNIRNSFKYSKNSHGKHLIKYYLIFYAQRHLLKANIGGKMLDYPIRSFVSDGGL